MEKWEKEHIRENLVPLINEINSSSILPYMLQSNIISREENEELNNIGRNTGLIAQSKKLLDIIRGRTYGYKHLTKALYISKQSGPMITLLYGVQINTNANPFRYCQIQLELGEFLPKNVTFGGHQVTLADICDNFNELQLFSLRGIIDVPIYKCLVGGDKLTIAKDTIPSVLSYYINRTLTLRNKLDVNIFKDRQQDYFLIKNIEPYQLTKLAQMSQLKETPKRSNPFSRRSEENNVTTSVSSVQILDLNTRFILLKKEQHFDIICKRWQSKSTHFIRFHDNNYFLEKSTDLKNIRNYLIEDELNILENEFLEYTKNSGPVIIFDTPGMGKSALLTSLSYQAMEKMPTEYVVYFEMQDLVDKLLVKNCDISVTLIKEVILDTISTNKFGEFINRELFGSRFRKIYLFLDAFDEVKFEQVEIAISIVKTLSHHQNIFKIYITSRPHQGLDLENVCNLIGYGIHPFQLQEQIDFLVDYWQKVYFMEKSTEIQQFARNCLYEFNFKTSSKDREITGIPLQCKMLADVYAKDAVTNSDSFSNSQIVINTIYDMYDGYFSQKFPNTFLKPGRSKLLDTHFKLALEFLFPEFSKTLVSWQELKCDRDIFSIGILESNKLGKEQFVHRTFAEFLVAKFVGSYMFDELSIPKIPKELVLKFGFREVLEVNEFKYSVHFYPLFSKNETETCFITYQASKFKVPILAFFLGNFITCNISDSREPNIAKILQSDKHLLTAKQCKDFLIASIESDLVGLYKLATSLSIEYFIKDLECNVDLRLEAFKSISFDIPLHIHYSTITFTEISLLHASQFSSLDILKLHCAFLTRLMKKPLKYLKYETEIIGKMHVSHPILYVAQRGEYHSFEYVFLNLKPDKALRSIMIFHCINDSSGDSINVINGKIQILNLITNDPSIRKIDFDKFSILSFKNVHVELLLFMFGHGANLFEKDDDGNTVVHKVVK